MIRLTDEQWERFRKHFPEEHVVDGRPGRKPASRREADTLLSVKAGQASLLAMVQLRWRARSK